MAGFGTRPQSRPDGTPPVSQQQVPFDQSGNGNERSPTAPTSNGSSEQETQSAPGQLLAKGSDRRSLQEKFNVDTRTGGVSFRLPIHASPGRSGFGPSLDLVYDSGSAGANGIFGLGWRLAGVDSIFRKTSLMVPTYDDDKDTFVHSSVGDLVPVLQKNSGEPIEREDKLMDQEYRVQLYRPRVESDPIRIERWSCSDGTVHWKTISSGNITTIFGQDKTSRVSHPPDGQSGGRELCFSWLESETYDSHGNQMIFDYVSDTAEDLAQAFEDKVYEVHRNATVRTTQRYLKSIKYGNREPNRDLETWQVLPRQNAPNRWMFEVVLDYREHMKEPLTIPDERDWNIRLDPFSTYSSGFEIRTYRRCQRVLMYHHFPEELKRQDCLVAATEFQYRTDQKSGASTLHSYTPCGYSLATDGGYSCLRLASTKFEYAASPDLCSAPVEEIDLDLSGLSTPAAQWVDLNGDGAPGVLAQVPGGGWYYHPNNSADKADIGGPTLISRMPNAAHSDHWSFEDFTGDGHLDMACVSADGLLRGFYERVENSEWSNFIPFELYPTAYSAADPTFVKVDLNGNGHCDLLHLAAQGDNELTWYPSLGRRGYGPEKRTTGAPAVPPGDARFFSLCDMTGDGLSDIVIVYNTHIYYRPNMGHGRFGQKVVMGNPPFLADSASFSPLRIRMADVTGTGTADLIYLPPDGGVRVYYNCSGNHWQTVSDFPVFPPLDRFCAVDVSDIGGRGTQCLCWTSDHLSRGSNAGSTTVRFLDLMGGCKPGLLTKCSNGIGGEVEITYRSSTQYHLDDRRAGSPWTTRLPFPIHCVKRMIQKDFVAETTCTKSFAYHNGYYDPDERQFRGFQMVEEWDEENFTTVSHKQRPAVVQKNDRGLRLNRKDADAVPKELDAAVVTEVQSSRPKVHTRSWFYMGSQQIDDPSILPWSYQVDHPLQQPLPSAKIRDRKSLTVEELQDGYRALAGQKRRQEVFGEDASSCKRAVPYLVTQQTYEVAMHQAACRSKRGIFRVNGREEITSSYDRDQTKKHAEEPKVQQSVVLKSDDYGNVCSQAVISYGNPNSKLGKQDKEKQQETSIHYTETKYTNSIDPFNPVILKPEYGYFQAPLPAAVSQYRMYPGSNWERSDQNRYSWETLAGMFLAAGEIPIDESPTNVDVHKASKMLISEMCTLYSKKDLSGRLPMGQVEPYSIEYQSYRLAFTRKLLEGALRNGDSPLLTSESLIKDRSHGYIQLDNRPNEWWAPSTCKFFIICDNIDNKNGDNKAVHEDTSCGNLAAARRHFYVPNAEIDQFDNVSFQSFDKHDLLLELSVDAVKNTTQLKNDYVHLKPALVTDTNGNRTETVFDPCGRSVGIAVMGKESKEEGDCLDTFTPTLTETQLEAFIENPLNQTAELLKNATRRILYSDHYRSGQQLVVPAFQAEIVRDRHYRDPCSPQISVHISYLNSNGSPIQTASLSGNTEEDRKWQFGNCVIHDSKGQPVRELLPFTRPTHHFQTQEQNAGVPATLVLRDALNRVVGQLNSDHTWSKTRFTPWSQVIFDTGDTVEIEDPGEDEDVGFYFKMIDRDSYFPTWYSKEISSPTDEDKQALCQSKAYSKTPTTIYMDPLGREIVKILDNGVKGSRTSSPPGQHTKHDIREVRTEYDTFGNVSVLRDACGRIVTNTAYDLLGRPLHSVNMDSGHTWLASDCNGAPLLSWQNGGPRKRIQYDALRRQKKIMLSSGSMPEECVVEFIYGEEKNKLEGVGAVEKNLKGQLYQCCDQSGKQTNHAFDFKGNCVETSVHYATEYKKRINWNKPVELDATIYKTTMSFDVLGHQVQSAAVDGENTTCTITRTYDVAGRLKAIRSLTPDDVEASVSNIEYSDDDKIARIQYKNGAYTTHEYDPKTRRLVNTRTNRTASPSCVQNISYVYDCVGRIVQKFDGAQRDVFFANSLVSPLQTYIYDALGQLIKATGREQVDGSQKHLPAYDACSSRTNRGNASQIIRYEETYQYDEAGNIEKIRHDPHTNGYQGWTRTYAYTERSFADSSPNVYSNRLSKTTSTGRIENYKYDDNEHSGSTGNKHDGNGCITSMPGYSLTWDHDNRLRSFSRQKATKGATAETTYYIYNARGERVRKVTDSGTSPNGHSRPTKMKQTCYLPLRDIYTKFGGSNAREATTVGVCDPSITQTPMVTMEMIKDHNKPGTRQDLFRYQVSDYHELDDHSNVISYEEFSPYGVSTYQSRITAAPRKYRFANYQHDSESGLYLCGERYYAPWLGRWTSADPVGTADGLNLYRYVSNDPVNLQDHTGTAGTSVNQAASSQEIELLSQNPLLHALGILGRDVLEKAYDLRLMTLGTQGAGDKQVTGISGKSSAPLSYNADLGRDQSQQDQKKNQKKQMQKLKGDTYQFEIRYDIETKDPKKPEKTPKGYHINLNFGEKGNEQKYFVKYKDESNADSMLKQFDFDIQRLTEATGWNKENYDNLGAFDHAERKNLQDEARSDAATKAKDYFLRCLDAHEKPPSLPHQGEAGAKWVPSNLQAILEHNRPAQRPAAKTS